MSSSMSESSFISAVRLPLCIAVILVHCDFPESVIETSLPNLQSEFLLRFFYLFSQILPAIAVPGFFFISGWLFFKEQESFSGEGYFLKVKKRLRTIVVPYFFWNLLLVLFIFLLQTLLPGLSATQAHLVSDFTFSDWVHVFWDYSSGTYPANFPLWYMRDLFIVLLLSPLLYPLIKKAGVITIVILGVMWLLDVTGHVVGLSPSAYFFFYLGVFFKINGHSFLTRIPTLFRPALLAYIVIIGLEIFLYDQRDDYQPLHRIGIMCGLIIFTKLSLWIISKSKRSLPQYISDSSFFLYAYHCIMVMTLTKLLFRFLKMETWYSFVLVYFARPAITIVIGVILYKLISHFLPRFSRVINGR